MKNMKNMSDEEFEAKCREQRADQGFADVEACEIDTWFMDIMPRMLKRFRENNMSIPCEGNLISHEICDEDDERLAEWNKIIDRMIFLLEEMNEDTCSMDQNKASFHEIFEYRNTCKNEFFELFSKHFWDLWD